MSAPVAPARRAGPRDPRSARSPSRPGRACWLYFALVGLLLLSEGSRGLAPLRDKRLAHLGAISYGIYLYHPFVLIFVPILQKAVGLKVAPWMMDAAKVLGCVGLAEVSWRLVERPLLRLKDRFPYVRAARGPSAPYNGPHAPPGLRTERITAR